MATRTRAPLSRERVFAAAIELADADGVQALTMRSLAQRLEVEPMSLYYHVAGKSALLDGIAEAVVTEILVELAADAASTDRPDVTPPPGSAPDGVPRTGDAPGPGSAPDALLAGGSWRAALRRRILLARSVLLRHPWAPALLTRPGAFGPSVAAYFDGVLAILLAGGFSHDLAHHALHALGSRALGFSQELFAPSDAAPQEMSADDVAAMSAQLPHLMGMLGAIAHDDAGGLGWCDDQAEFEFGVDVLLDGLEAARLRAVR